MFWYMYTWGNVLPTREPVNKYSKELPISLFVEIRPHSKFQVYSTVLLSVVPSLYISRTNPLLNGSHVRICWPSYTWMITKPVFPRPEISGQGVAKLCLKETLCCLSRCLSFAIKIPSRGRHQSSSTIWSNTTPSGYQKVRLSPYDCNLPRRS